MNRGVLESSPVQQMMTAGNPSWWNINNNLMRSPLSSSSPSSNSNTNHHDMNISSTANFSSSWLDDNNTINHNHNQLHQQLPESWCQLLLGGVCMEEEAKKMESWEEQVMVHHQQASHPNFVDVKQESSLNSYNNNNNNNNINVYIHHGNIQASSTQSCVTTFSSSNNMMNFCSSKSSDRLHAQHPPPTSDRSSECKSTATGGALKKARVQSSSSTQSTFKVRKEKLGDRITALHQLVSPFGKTDTASVLLEAIGYIRFLQSQIEALSIPYLGSGAANKRQPHSVQGERSCIFPEDPGQLLNDICLKRKGGPDQDSYEDPKDLRSRGLCLVPVSCTLHVGRDNGADYWAPAMGGGFR